MAVVVYNQSVPTGFWCHRDISLILNAYSLNSPIDRDVPRRAKTALPTQRCQQMCHPKQQNTSEGSLGFNAEPTATVVINRKIAAEPRCVGSSADRVGQQVALLTFLRN